MTGQSCLTARFREKAVKDKLTRLVFLIIKFLIRVFYPKTEFKGTENIPDGPVIIVGNHAKTNAPIACELYFP